MLCSQVSNEVTKQAEKVWHVGRFRGRVKGTEECSGHTGGPVGLGDPVTEMRVVPN